ncbi:adenylate kinase [Candidatus Bandiella euplotis]|uniref:Adenylate kinase n=1 Tax=Candidatus Bandiella euplotis TaxID=1664265 RepID=A0ABZ0ULD5_9RICK|nr:adenylate kinase [Candidatus Bandiella woodruffii]WPX96762.1 Adenylate kinase [Candidatus Bandiella woodruffii]
MLVILLGAPGVGKGTQAKLLAEKYSLAILSTGEILRSAVNQGQKIGSQIKDIMSKGGLIPDEIVCSLVEERLKKKSTYNGYILDGFPRTIYQADRLKNIISANTYFDNLYIISLVLDEKEITKRLSSRVLCKNCDHSYNLLTKPTKVRGKCDICGCTEFYVRDDDKEEAVKIRLSAYLMQTAPLIDYYRCYDRYVEIDASQDIIAVHSDITSFIKQYSSLYFS